MSELFMDILEAGFYGSIVIGLVLMLRLVLKKAPRWMICLLWLLAAVRLLCPFQIESGFSLQPDLTPLPQVQTQEAPEAVSPMVPAAPDNVVLPEGEDIQVVFWDDAVIEEHHQTIEWDQIAALVWAVAAAGMGLYSIAAYLRLKHRVREAVKLVDNVYECAGLDTAFVLGYLWPRIYIPMGLENPKYIVDHERAHIRRGDHWFKLIMFAALAVHWFNPLVWAAYICLCRDLEMACDERVIRDMSLEQRKAYSAALLACSAGHRSFAACPVAFGEVSVKTRILGVLNYRRPRFWICLVAIIAIVFVAVCFMTNPAEQDVIPDQGDATAGVQETTATEDSDSVQQEIDALSGVLQDEVKQQIQEQQALARCQTALSNLQASANCYMTGRNEFYAGGDLSSETEVQFYLAGDEWLRIAQTRQGAQTHKHLYLDGVLYNQISSNGPSTQTPEWMMINTDSESHLWPFQYEWNPGAVLVSAESEDGMVRITVKVNEPVSVSGMVMDTHTLEVCLDEAGDLKSIMISNMEDPADAERSGIRLTMEVVSTSPDAAIGVLGECRQQIDSKFHPLNADITIPNNGQGYLEAAQAYGDAIAERFQQAPSGTKYSYLFATCQVEAAENETAFQRRRGMIDENTQAIALTMIFLPENERALAESMAGNTTSYTGNDPDIPAGAYLSTLCGYITLTADGWQGWITGTSW